MRQALAVARAVVQAGSTVSAQTFTARYPGRCAECSRAVIPGDEATRLSDGSIVHADCDAVPSSLPKGARMPKLCGTCQLEHAGECW